MSSRRLCRLLGLVLVGSALVAPVAVAQTSSYQLVGNQLKLPGQVEFESRSDKLRPESESVLHFVKNYLDEKTSITMLRIEVHSDSQGGSAYNQQLSERRALSVGRWLVSRGVDCKRLLAVGFGETKPIADNATPEGRAQNRRVAFVNAALRGRPIGGLPLDGGGKAAGDLCSDPRTSTAAAPTP
jgi:OOP family OmpA-OmpF porin